MKVTKFLAIALIGFACLFVSGRVFAQDVNVDYDHSYDYSKLKTFFIKIGTTWGNPLGEHRVIEIFTAALKKKGWTPTDDEASADAEVVLHGATQEKKDLNTFY